MTTRASVSPVKRVVFGGPRLGDLVVEVRNDKLIIRRKGQHRKTAVIVSWNRIYTAMAFAELSDHAVRVTPREEKAS